MKSLVTAILLMVSLTACGKAPATMPTFTIDKATAVPQLTASSEAPTAPLTAPEVVQPAPSATYSVLKNWGWMGQLMPLDFRALTVGPTVRVMWDQYEPGQFGVDGRQVRRCRADVTLTGTAESGVFTIANSMDVWSIDPAEAFNNPPCPGVPNGTHPYSVGANGMTFDGVVHAEL